MPLSHDALILVGLYAFLMLACALIARKVVVLKRRDTQNAYAELAKKLNAFTDELDTLDIAIARGSLTPGWAAYLTDLTHRARLSGDEVGRHLRKLDAVNWEKLPETECNRLFSECAFSARNLGDIDRLLLVPAREGLTHARNGVPLGKAPEARVVET